MSSAQTRGRLQRPSRGARPLLLCPRVPACAHIRRTHVHSLGLRNTDYERRAAREPHLSPVTLAVGLLPVSAGREEHDTGSQTATAPVKTTEHKGSPPHVGRGRCRQTLFSAIGASSRPRARQTPALARWRSLASIASHSRPREPRPRPGGSPSRAASRGPNAAPDRSRHLPPHNPSTAGASEEHSLKWAPPLRLPQQRPLGSAHDPSPSHRALSL
jgi:hypothetical protein